ncbi:TSUP family transporter [Aliiroseovarius sp. KMU-50]|uniref:Probable membrane transporter protein n=1 Tax=Aliiroseovarius salicola TaxID=3009082 RepID=A0ABT4VWX1_9RHOB|nr:TSUP family transporter [Aliiroseovarius sp. KMU-50]MDA5092743.1 TSUP family transporter [Aliiroseovarius sp. KMU-50]
MIEISFDLFALLLGAAFIAGFVDAIAGGGGLITVPALLLAGVPPVTALATNKVQGLFGAGMAAITYARAGHVNLRRQIRPAILSFAGGILGALLASSLPTDLIRMGLPVLLISVALFFALKPGLDDVDKHERISPFLFSLTFVPAIGFYDGLLGPGTGAFFMLGFVSLAGYGILRATAHTKLLNFASNIGGLAGFALVVQPLWLLGLAMGAAQIAGAWLGSHLASKIGAKLIKPVLVIASSVLAIKLISEWF